MIYTRDVTRVVFASLKWVAEFCCGAQLFFLDDNKLKVGSSDMSSPLPFQFYEVALVTGGSWWLPVTTSAIIQSWTSMTLKKIKPSREYWCNMKASKEIETIGLQRACMVFLWIPAGEIDAATAPLELNGKIEEGHYPFPQNPPP